LVPNPKLMQGATWKDIIWGEVKGGQSTKQNEVILIKKDGSPGRSLADTVDDYEMKISHALREEVIIDLY
jgi:glutamyl/glutaminyl-tRNA synthetase